LGREVVVNDWKSVCDFDDGNQPGSWRCIPTLYDQITSAGTKERYRTIQIGDSLVWYIPCPVPTRNLSVIQSDEEMMRVIPQRIGGVELVAQ
jgi:hypothetical protein